jgi:hypothetical protein
LTSRQFYYWHLTTDGWVEGKEIGPPGTILTVRLKWSESEWSAWETKAYRLWAVETDDGAIMDAARVCVLPDELKEFGFSTRALAKDLADFRSGKPLEKSFYSGP